MVASVPIQDAGAAPAAAPPTKRGLELVMLAFASIVVTSALVLVELNQPQGLTQAVLYDGVAYLALFSAAHIAVRWLAPYADPLILPCVALLNGLGLVVIHRLDLADAAVAVSAREPVPAGNLQQQIAWTTLGLGLFVAVLWMVRDHRMLARYGYTYGLVGLGALALPGLLPAVVSEVNGAKIWLRFGVFSIQPGEFAKILLMIFVAAFLVTKRDLFTTAGRKVLGMELPRGRDLAPLLAAWGALPGSAGIGEGSRHLTAVLRRCAGADLRRHRTHCLAGDRDDLLSGWRVDRELNLPARAQPGKRLDQPVR
jgi:hypothetical protein